MCGHTPIKYLKDPNITSVGIGYKRTDSKETSQLAIQFSVNSKVKPEDISALGSSPIPKKLSMSMERPFQPM